MVLFMRLNLTHLQRRNTATIALSILPNSRYYAPNEVRFLCKKNRSNDALRIIRNQPLDSPAYHSLLQGCIHRRVLPEGKLIHAHILQSGFICGDVSLGNKLVTIYAKYGSLADACRVLDQMAERDVLSWTVMISAYARNGYAEEALELFYKMRGTGIQPDLFTFASVLPACADLEDLKQGKEIHEEIVRSGFRFDVFVGNAIVDMYAKCSCVETARELFDRMLQRDLVTWNTMIAGYVYNGRVDEALEIFHKMPKRDIVSWNSMIAGYAQNGCGEEALRLFRKMVGIDMKSNSKTFAILLSACAELAALDHGMEIHRQVIQCGFQFDVVVLNALVDMYAKCGSTEDARNVFDKMSRRDAVSWNAMITGYAQKGQLDKALTLFRKMERGNVISWTSLIAGYAQHGEGEEALQLFKQMQLAGVQPNSKTYVSVLPACATLVALEQGKEIHGETIRSGLQSNVYVGSALVDMYAKCGSIENARIIFNKMSQRNVVTWTAMISGYAMHGFSKDALELLLQMECCGLNPNPVTLVGVLSACCHAGLVDEGRRYFNRMTQNYHITPMMEHYVCMVDLFGRAGCLDEAQYFIDKMPMKPDATVWGCLLGACRIHNNIGLGEYAAEHLFELDPENAVPYVMLSNIYAAAGRWEGIEKLRKMMKDKNVKKKPGCSWIEINKQVHAFIVGNNFHQQASNIHAKLQNLFVEIKAAGYVPDVKPVVNYKEEQELQTFCHHSEKLLLKNE